MVKNTKKTEKQIKTELEVVEVETQTKPEPPLQTLEGYTPWNGPCALPDGTTCKDPGCWDFETVTDAITGEKKQVKISNCKNKKTLVEQAAETTTEE